MSYNLDFKFTYRVQVSHDIFHPVCPSPWYLQIIKGCVSFSEPPLSTWIGAEGHCTKLALEFLVSTHCVYALLNGGKTVFDKSTNAPCNFYAHGKTSDLYLMSNRKDPVIKLSFTIVLSIMRVIEAF